MSISAHRLPLQDEETEVLSESELRDILDFSGVHPRWWEDLLEEAAAARRASEEWRAWADWLALPPEQQKLRARPEVSPSWHALQAARRIDAMRKIHAGIGVPMEITLHTARDLGIWIDEAGGATTLGRSFPLSWFRNHARGNLLRLGRLQFVAESWGEIFDVFLRNTSLPESVAMARGGVACDSGGWPTSETPAFVTTREQTPESLCAHAASRIDGSISPEPCAISLGEWRRMIFPGVTVLQVHIPAGDPLRFEDCVESIRRVRVLYPRFFPDSDWKAICCNSWLLDRELWKVMPSDSGIRRFAELFTPLTILQADDRQLVERVLENTQDIANFVPRTSLQKRVLDHMRRGGVFRKTAGYIL